MQLRGGTLLVALVLAVSVACSPGATTIGPLTLDVPDGWGVSDREGDNLKLTDGTIAAETATEAGTATAVFDIYVNSAQTVEAFRTHLREQNIDPRSERMEIDGYEATVLSYGGRAAGGRQEAVFIPRWRVFILYRAAFRNDDEAFARGRPAFREAVASIRFSGTPAALGA